MKKLLAIGLATCIPAAIAADPPSGPAHLGTMAVLVLEDAQPQAAELACSGSGIEQARASGACASTQQAVLSVHVRRASVLAERGRWL